MPQTALKLAMLAALHGLPVSTLYATQPRKHEPCAHNKHATTPLVHTKHSETLKRSKIIKSMGGSGRGFSHTAQCEKLRETTWPYIVPTKKRYGVRG